MSKNETELLYEKYCIELEKKLEDEIALLETNLRVANETLESAITQTEKITNKLEADANTIKKLKSSQEDTLRQVLLENKERIKSLQANIDESEKAYNDYTANFDIEDFIAFEQEITTLLKKKTNAKRIYGREIEKNNKKITKLEGELKETDKKESQLSQVNDDLDSSCAKLEKATQEYGKLAYELKEKHEELTQYKSKKPVAAVRFEEISSFQNDLDKLISDITKGWDNTKYNFDKISKTLKSKLAKFVIPKKIMAEFEKVKAAMELQTVCNDVLNEYFKKPSADNSKVKNLKIK